MIQLAPIDPLVQKTLEHKERAFNSKKTGNVLGSSNYLKNTGPVALSLRTTFVRMTSLVGRDIESLTILQGGEMVDGKLRSGLATTDSHENLNGTIYGPVTDLNTEKTTANKYYRPMAGLKSIDVQFKGAVKALREGAISWTCWSFEDLERLTPYFLWHGKHILLEWGWNLIEGVSTDKIKPKLFNIDNITKGNVDDDLVKHIRNQEGNYDAMLGVVANYEYTSRDDGGFDCNTKIIARGTNMFKNSISSASNKGVVRLRTETTTNTNELKVTPEKVGFNTYIKDLKRQLIRTHAKYGHKMVLGGSKRGILYGGKTTSKGQLWNEYDIELGPYCTFGWLEDNILSRFFGRVSENKILFEMRSIEPKYIRNNDKISEVNYSGVRIANHRELKTVRPVKVTGVDETGKHVMIIPGQWVFGSVTFEQYKWSGKEVLVFDGWDTNFRKVENPDFKKTEALYSLVKEFEPFRGKPALDSEGEIADITYSLPDNRGYIRNLLLHHELIEDAFLNASTLENGMSNLFNNMNYDYDGFWDFRLSKSEGGNRVKVIDGRITDTPARTYIDTKNNVKNSNYNNDGMYIFPVWEATSIVKGQTFSAKLPDKMQYAAMYASNSDHSTDNTEDEGQEKDFSTTAAAGASEGQLLGRLYNPNYDGKLNIGHDLIANKDTIPFKFNRKFGSLTTDETESLTVEDISWGKSKKTPEKGVEITTKAINEELVGGHEMGIKTLLKIEDDYEKKRIQDSLAKEGENAVTETGDTVQVESGAKLSQPMYDVKGVMKTGWKEFMLGLIINDETGIHNTTDPLLNIELELEIDGTGGIFPGNVFHSSYLPKKIRDNTVYQALDVNHRVDSSFWSTTIRGQMRYAGAGDAAQKIVETTAYMNEMGASAGFSDKDEVLTVNGEQIVIPSLGYTATTKTMPTDTTKR